MCGVGAALSSLYVSDAFKCLYASSKYDFVVMITVLSLLFALEITKVLI